MFQAAKVYIIILNYKGWKDTIECLISVLSLKYDNYQILVVDNNSPDHSFSQLTTWANTYFKNAPDAFSVLKESEALSNTRSKPTSELAARIIFIEANANRGFAAGNNIAMQYALGKADFNYLWLLNNDTTVDKESLSALINQAVNDCSKNNNIGIWGSKLLFYHRPTIIQALGGKFNHTTFTTKHIGENQADSPAADETVLEADYIVGASMFVSAEFVTKVGLLDENYFLYFEELDWATRGRQKGFQLGYASESRVYHKEGQTIGSSSNGAKKSILADIEGVRSKIHFVKKFYPAKMPLLYLILLASVFLRLKRLQFNRAKSILRLMIQRGV
ncbi:glycosyltransferase family 2 protein [Pontibacter oryzae]|uniref:Glycosyltransferase family 2 protein n=1 Tax=Pontibacter oryzae TaxID=2304593 RepID=A0A399SF69_9BACT|nr:glycosyltransferase family 2 protein [Pontibacter oryzae]RIJ41459.1 glycosyltransferase family 2 protein [Pontibacter oryzae]